MFASKQKKELMDTFGRVQGMAEQRTAILNELLSLPEVISDEGSGPCRVLVSDGDALGRRSAWQRLSDMADSELDIDNQMLALIDDYHGAVSGEFRDFAEQDIKQCLLAIALGEANVSSIDAAQSGVSIEDWRSRKMNWGNPP
jgi:hypothetical protein